MHPKKLEDITIKDDEICDSLKAFIWINDNFGYMLENMEKNSRERLEIVTQEIQELKRSLPL